MMNRKIKEKWLNALRSGKFSQTRGHLRDSKGYCCLGVLCEVTGNAGNRIMSLGYPIDNPDSEDLPKPFCGLSPRMQANLAEMNDTGLTFEEIATYISRNVKAKD